VRRQIPVVLSAVREIAPTGDSDVAANQADMPASGSKLQPVSPRAWRALWVASLATVLVGFNSTATNIALDDIQRGFTGASAADIGWGVAGFLLVPPPSCRLLVVLPTELAESESSNWGYCFSLSQPSSPPQLER